MFDFWFRALESTVSDRSRVLDANRLPRPSNDWDRVRLQFRQLKFSITIPKSSIRFQLKFFTYARQRKQAYEFLVETSSCSRRVRRVLNIIQWTIAARTDFYSLILISFLAFWKVEFSMAGKFDFKHWNFQFENLRLPILPNLNWFFFQENEDWILFEFQSLGTSQTRRALLRSSNSIKDRMDSLDFELRNWQSGHAWRRIFGCRSNRNSVPGTVYCQHSAQNTKLSLLSVPYCLL